MYKSIATVSLSGGLLQKLEAIAAAGFNGVELFENDLINFHGSPRDLKKIATDHGLDICLYQPFRDFEAVDHASFLRNLDRAEYKFDVMQELGVDLVLCCSNTSPETIDSPELAAQQLHALAERAHRRQLRIGYEALSWGARTRLYSQAWDIVRQADHPSLGLILDSFHTLALKDDPSQIANIPGEKIFFLQMADAPWLSMDVISWARHHRNFPAQGELAVVDFFKAALQSGYNGPLSLEIFNDIFREIPNKRTAVDAMRSLRYLESCALEQLGGAEKIQADIKGLSAAPQLHGIAFIEISATQESLAETVDAIQKMGFIRKGQHPIQQDVLYAKGEFHIVVSKKSSHAAGLRFDGLPAFVSAIGLHAEEPEKIFSRALELCSLPGQCASYLDDSSCSSIVMPGGALIHFIPAQSDCRLFKAFLSDAPPATEQPPFRLDHLSLNLTSDQKDTLVLFLRAVLGLEIKSKSQFPDNFGLIQNLSLKNATDAIHFSINYSSSQTTRSAKFARAQSGISINQIALSTPDIFDAVSACRARGAKEMPVSMNYYADLAARQIVEKNRIIELQQHNITLEPEQDGELLHASFAGVHRQVEFKLIQKVKREKTHQLA